MSVTTLPDRPKSVNPGLLRTPAAQRGSDRATVRSEERRKRARQSAEAVIAAARTVAEVRRIEELRELVGLGVPVSSLGLGSTHTYGLRERPRHEGLILGEVERQRAREMARRAEGCGTSYGAFRRYEVVTAGIQEHRLVVQKFCGTRACDRCDTAIRRRECARVAWGWTQFHTLGFPPWGLSVRQGWHRVRRARTLLIKRLEIALARGRDDVIRVSAEAVDRARAHRAQFLRERMRESKLEYAWCIEPHVSGFPHLHFVTNTEYISFRWLRAIWGECIGRVVQWSRTEEVWDPSGTCRYLSKYISKCTLSLDLCAVMYRQRLWGTSLPRAAGDAEAWIEEEGTENAEAAAQCDDNSNFAESSKWDHVGGSPGKYRRWQRVWAVETPEDAAAFDAATWRYRAPRPDRAPEYEGPEWYRGTLWPLWDLISEVCVTALSGRWSLTVCDKVWCTRQLAS